MKWSDLPQEYRDLANSVPTAFIQETENIIGRFILAYLPMDIDFWMMCYHVTTVSELPPISKSISKEEIQKDVSLFVAFFYHQKYISDTNMGVLSTFDIVYNLAIQFVGKYPPNFDWEESGTDYETTAHKFILDNFINKVF